ncbi:MULTISPECIES: DegQ family serine endoprotease [unclassified Agarivorans]|uniref:DegQ family serine endoprotease n=1 Tax=unclassified Agarivorans TaxID=2636026 RepID=UPI0026E1DF2D|nr:MULTISPECIES: DegQ family serine endoprotease [unclassified Agarivorans]MDO6686886.1 DegQ family serine endoprotease [Agarivorans sp. 3_MG-2023]MDO6716683.1 DegQ family serine endoprotease [Agarivorans sp. 2_MG-2023]
MSKSTKKFVILLFSLFLGTTTLQAQAALPFSVGGEPLPSLAPVLEQTTPAVVNISVAGTKVSQQQLPELFKYFFGPGGNPDTGEQERPFQGLGSGVVIDAKKGYVITNYHVIHEADEIVVTLKDGRTFEAEVLGSDRHTDIALLKIDADELVDIKLSDSDELRVGDFAIAIGNPFGLGQTVTSGIVSALGRSGLNIENLENFIQTDAAINSGNSGGALINLRGELIGINTAIIAPNGGNIGIGFAIPSNMVRNLADQIIEFGEVRRGVLGVTGGELNSDLAKAFGTDSQHGAFVNQVMQGSAADQAGIKPGDIIIAVDDKKVKSFAELRAKIGTMGAGKTIKIGAIRDGEDISFKVTLQQAEEQNINAKVMHPALEGASLSSTAKGADISGVVVSKIQRNSKAFANGFEEGDIIIGINKIRISSIADLRELLETEPKVLAVNIQRGDENLYRIIQ